ncbi:sulfotransferase domain-containing protein [Pelagibacterales bacterium SAG-MED13]|mgnify:CR=1 FL=1|nr:sulfotransferase domain-containing protein [Pelagibacterales bacterium SAG-MED13]|tara:strand:- start:1746 stop:2588 length:843 start_codon:yes stop_codon:yes gene_type:complete
MIIWIASYPKSGNTWMRAIISSLIYSDDGLFNFSYIEKIRQFPQKKYFEEFTDKLSDINELKKYWILAQEKINLDNKIKFLKTHHINCKIDNFAFTDKQCTKATIYIVRDPRNLVDSISNHFSKSTKEAKEFLLSTKIISRNTGVDLKGDNIVTMVGSWKEHYRFWNNNTENILLIKYEDLLNNVSKELDRIIIFLKKFIEFNVSEKKKKNIIETTSFNFLKKLEDQGDFKENVSLKGTDKKIPFFNKGPKNIWQGKLDKEIQIEIEKKFKSELVELGYL